jgi:DNA-binding winged helix-turn-helix (wHTH) protein
MYRWGDLRLNTEACEVSYQGKALRLYPKEYELLKIFFDYPKRVLSPSFIIDHLWSFDSTPTESAVRTHIKGLRRKLKDAGADDVIQTVHGFGYRLKPLHKETPKTDSSLSPMLIKLLALHEIEYVIADRNLIILEISPGVKNFSDYPWDITLGREVTLAFPELIGLESIFLEILENQESKFEIKGIARAKNSLRPEYINIYAMTEPTEEHSSSRLLILFEDSSEKMIWKQQVVQQENESYLLLGELSKS